MKQATYVRYSATRIWWERIKPRLQFYRDMAVGPIVVGGAIWAIW